MCEQCNAIFNKELDRFRSYDWEKISGAREFDQRETLVKAKKYLEIAQAQGFELAYAQLNADIAKLDWFLARVSLALEEKRLKQKTENWLNAVTRLAHTKNACRPCDINGQVSQDNSHYRDNKTAEDTAQFSQGLSSEDNAIEQSVMTAHDLIVVSAVFKVITKHGIEGAKAYFAVEHKKRELLAAYQLKSALCTKNEE